MIDAPSNIVIRWKPYPKYKDSGMVWLKEIPAHWKLISLKRIARIRYGLSQPPTELIDGLPLIRATNIKSGQILEKDMLYVNPAGVPPSRDAAISAGDIIVVRSGAYTGDSAIIPEQYEGAIAGYDIILTIRNGFSSFFSWQLLSPHVRELQFGFFDLRAAQPHLNTEQLGATLFLAPSIPEQRAIAAFLDRETAKIDALIAKKERLIELLKEKRAALINHAVTKGLDPSVPMKDSGMEWLGEIPEHWKVRPFKFVTNRIDVGIAEAATHAYADEGVPIIRSTNVKPNNLDLKDIFNIEKWFAEKNKSKYLKKGDIVTVRTGNAGVSAVVPESLDKSQCFTLLISTLHDNQIAEFYCYYLNAMPGQIVFKIEGWGTAQVNISVPILKNLLVASPQYEEQLSIVSYLKYQTARTDSLIYKINENIENLREYRTALISATVTGKIDVRDEVCLGGTA